MQDQYIEIFCSDAVTAEREEAVLSEDYATTGRYAVTGGWVVYADRNSDRGL